MTSNFDCSQRDFVTKTVSAYKEQRHLKISEKHKYFKNVQKTPDAYYTNYKAWITGNICDKWLEDLDSRFSAEKREVLIVDNCTDHKYPWSLGNLCGVFSTTYNFNFTANGSGDNIK